MNLCARLTKVFDGLYDEIHFYRDEVLILGLDSVGAIWGLTFSVAITSI